jgi:hypothetical protein
LKPEDYFFNGVYVTSTTAWGSLAGFVLEYTVFNGIEVLEKLTVS